ncbi:tRNA (adenosine(37)-N6)-threonylcarbamoyltransferase complex ATPase subunit type 1 TsaE [Candidatus Kaiserbacteria bacterium]|nr:tRNA (adenosine(37)-N6)-threonylcarbamoyltransferase complex ATPase subunit type 1 TsaE [Candidatus Kaiserbacteria bacterium]
MEVSLEDLPDFAKDFIARLPKTPRERAYVVGLRGELGAGKTTFVQELAQVLGVTNPVTSPTFVIVQTYPITHPSFSRLIHVDAYRLTPEGKDTIGWKEYAADPENLILAEWPERLPAGARADMILEFLVAGENTRSITEHYENR